MKCHRLAAGLVVRAPAKVNLFLEVLGKRADGFHEIETLMCPVTLFDSLYCTEETSHDVVLTTRWAVPSCSSVRALCETYVEGEDNTVVRAAKLLADAAGIRRGIRFHLVKRIPVISGLAGGSADAAAALLAANEIWGAGLSTRELEQLAAQIGSDVPFFLRSGPAICRGRGERIEAVPAIAPLELVLVRPNVGLATADVYGACRPATRRRKIEPLVEALTAGRTRQAIGLLHNRLQPAARELAPEIQALERHLSELDIMAHQMTGSGSCFFAVCRHHRHARHVAGRLRARRIGAVFQVRTCR